MCILCRLERTSEVHREVSVVKRIPFLNSCAEVHSSHKEKADSSNPTKAHLWILS